jgi:hypothetical protein
LVTAIAAVPRNSGAIMSTTTQIEWTDATWNPVTGCSKITRLIVDKFARLETTSAEIERFVVRHTPFRETHYKKVLQALEQADKIVPIDPPLKRRRGTYADMNMSLSFMPKKAS